MVGEEVFPQCVCDHGAAAERRPQSRPFRSDLQRGVPDRRTVGADFHLASTCSFPLHSPFAVVRAEGF